MDGLISFLIQNGIIFETAHIDHMGGAGSNLPRGLGSQNEKVTFQLAVCFRLMRSRSNLYVQLQINSVLCDLGIEEKISCP